MSPNFGHILTLLGALAGLFGKRWDDTKCGWRRLTPAGWVALAVILCGFSISLRTTYRDQQRRSQLQAVAAAEIDQAWRALVYPFTLMLWEFKGQSVGYDASELNELLQPDVQEKLAAMDIRGDGPRYMGS